MPHPNHVLLRDAIARNSAAVLALPSAGMMRHHKTRLLAETSEGFWIEAIGAEDRPLIDALIAESQPVGIAFKSGHTSVVLKALIRKPQEPFKVNEETVVDAMFLAFPQDFIQQQRRKAYRVSLPPGHQIGLRLWRIPEHAILRDRPLASLELFANLHDLCVMGLGVRCRPGRDGQPAKVQPNERLRIVLTWEKNEVLTEGRVMHKRLLDSGLVEMGIQLKKLEKDIDGRQTLAKLTELVGYLQREEIKRLKQTAGAA
jgi:hypothetical protein